jgi:hypothetical protein
MSSLKIKPTSTLEKKTTADALEERRLAWQTFNERSQKQDSDEVDKTHGLTVSLHGDNKPRAPVSFKMNAGGLPSRKAERGKTAGSQRIQRTSEEAKSMPATGGDGVCVQDTGSGGTDLQNQPPGLLYAYVGMLNKRLLYGRDTKVHAY